MDPNSALLYRLHIRSVDHGSCELRSALCVVGPYLRWTWDLKGDNIIMGPTKVFM